MKKSWVIILIILGLLILVLGIFKLGNLKNSEVIEKECQMDSDCIPNSCCHASQCMPKNNTLNCSGVFCTMNCEPGTLDCGGKCLCEKGKCKANIN